MDPASEIREAIAAEINATRKGVRLGVQAVEASGNTWIVTADPRASEGQGLDEGLENATAWWPGPPSGRACVFAVLADEHKVVLRYVTTTPPPPGQSIWIFEPAYLEGLREYWQTPELAVRSASWLERVPALGDSALDAVPAPGPFSALRAQQRRSLRLLSRALGFLHGPPGTGKSFTLARALALMLLTTGQRVLLLSNTNSAVDDVLLELDRALASVGTPDAERARRSCARLGSNFRAPHYLGRDHLIPAATRETLERLVELRLRQPDRSDAHAYAKWKVQEAEARAAMRVGTLEVVGRSRLVAATTTRAVFSFRDLSERAPYDLLAIDEASQVPLAVTLALAPLARRVLLAGDPRQLAPIVRSESPYVVRWLGASPFDLLERAGTESRCFLDEQTRMAEPICALVSNVFYDGELRVADEVRQDPAWLRERELAAVPGLAARAVHVEQVEGEWVWRRGSGKGPVRKASCDFVVDLVLRLLAHGTRPEDLLVVTPFRAQRHLIKYHLRSDQGGRRVDVSTVHRAQGGQRHTVVFDPVDAASKFLRDEAGRRLMNVALSRAKARLVVVVSSGDLANETVRRIVTVVGHAASDERSVPLEALVQMPEWRTNVVGKVLRIGDSVGRVLRIERGGDHLVLLDGVTGVEKPFRVSVWLAAWEKRRRISLSELAVIAASLGGQWRRDGDFVAFTFSGDKSSNADALAARLADGEVHQVERAATRARVWLRFRETYLRRMEQ